MTSRGKALALASVHWAVSLVIGRFQPHTAGPRQCRWQVHCLDYLHKGIDVLAIRASSPHNGLLVAKPSGYGSSNAQHEPTSHRNAAPR